MITPEELSKIEARAEKAGDDPDAWDFFTAMATDDVLTLVREVRELQRDLRILEKEEKF